MGFYVLKSDLNDVGSAYENCKNDVEGKIEKLGTAISELVWLASLRGAAADSIKAYFAETHLVFASSIATLAGQLSSDYFASYMDRYTNEPLHENDWGKLSEDELETKLQCIDDWKAICDGDIEDEVKAAMHALPEGMHVGQPNSRYAYDELCRLHKDVEDLISDVRESESSGKAAFSADQGCFAELYAALSNALSQCMSQDHSISAYVPGTFSATVDEVDLGNAYNASDANQEANFDKMIQNQEVMYGEVYQREALRLAEEQRIYDTLGVILGVGILIVGVAATVATAGAATPLAGAAIAVLGGLSAGSTANDVVNRMKTMSARDARMKEPAGGRNFTADNISADPLDDFASIGSAVVEPHEKGFSGIRVGESVSHGARSAAFVATSAVLEGYKDESSFAQSMAIESALGAMDVMGDPFIDRVTTGAKLSVNKLDVTSAALSVAQGATDFKSNELEGKIVENQRQYQDNVSQLKGPSFLERNSWATAWS